MLELKYVYGIWTLSNEDGRLNYDTDLEVVLNSIKTRGYKAEEVKVSTYLYSEETYENLKDAIESAMEVLWKNCYEGDTVKVEMSLKYQPEEN